MPGIKDWIAKASGDLKSSKKLIKDDDETLDSAAYFTQQSAEKALKSYLIFKQQPIPRTHDLEKLLKDCMKYDSTFDRLREDIEPLAPYATYTRYPDDRFSIDRDEVLKAIICAEKILKFVKTKIEPAKKTPQLSLFE
jgi:HEPN domain-containing protein